MAGRLARCLDRLAATCYVARVQTNQRSGQYLRDVRLGAHLSQIELAAALGVTRQTVIGWEHRAYVPAHKADAYLRAVRDLASRDAA